MEKQSSHIVLFGVMIAVIVALVSSVAGPKGTAKTSSWSRIVFWRVMPAGSGAVTRGPGAGARSPSPDEVARALTHSLAAVAQSGARTVF